MLNKPAGIYAEIVDVLQRIERLTAQIELHSQQPVVDLVAIEGYQRLREQYVHQMEELLAVINIQATLQVQTV